MTASSDMTCRIVLCGFWYGGSEHCGVFFLCPSFLGGVGCHPMGTPRLIVCLQHALDCRDPHTLLLVPVAV